MLLLNSRYETGIKKIQQFKIDFDKNPLYALDWSRSVFYAAAENDLIETVKLSLKSGERTPEEVGEKLKQELLQRCQSCGNKSTSQTSNLVEEYKIEALAKIIEILTSPMYE